MLELVIDTETTGLYPDNHRIIELACVDLSNTQTGRIWHSYFEPGRDIEEKATAVHGITRDMLKGSPKFADKADEFIRLVKGMRLVAHNAPFDIGFLNAELGRLGKKMEPASVVDTLSMARKALPGKKHTLDALCKHYGLKGRRDGVHGATLDALLLAEVYIRLEGRLTQLGLFDGYVEAEKTMPHPGARPSPWSYKITPEEEAAHAKLMKEVKNASTKET